MLEAKETTLILCDYGKLRGTHCHTSLNENYSLSLGCCIQLAARLRCTTQPLMTMCACMYLGAGCHRHGRWYQADSLHRWGWFLPYSPSCFQKRVMNLDMNMRHTDTHTHSADFHRKAHDKYSFRHSKNCNGMTAWNTIAELHNASLFGATSAN